MPVQNIKAIKTLIYIILVIFIATLVLTIVFYPDAYKFFTYFISELGATHTLEGSDNSISRLIFTIGFIAMGVIGLIMSIEYFAKRNRSKLNTSKGIFLIIMFLGAIATVFPYDIPSFSMIHRYGAMVFVLGLFVYCILCQFLRLNRIHGDQVTRKKIDFDQIFLIFLCLILIGYLVLAILRGVLCSSPTDCIYQDLQPPLQKIVAILAMFGIVILDNDDF